MIRTKDRDFTLIELSIVLVIIIGIIIGGGMVGQALIRNSEMMMSVGTEVKRYITAINTFRGLSGSHARTILTARTYRAMRV